MTSQTSTYAEIIAATGLTMTAEWAESNPNMPHDRHMTHYLCTISNADGETMEVPFSMGAAHTSAPDLETVLDCLASDASSAENASDWADWADEMGMLGEGVAAVRSAQATFATIERQADELRALVGDETYETLLWSTERL
jgi:hypothetical protein